VNLRPFGHAAIRYHDPYTQECIVANISKETGVALVNFGMPLNGFMVLEKRLRSKVKIPPFHVLGGVYSRHVMGHGIMEYYQVLFIHSCIDINLYGNGPI
jgi:hypothetical protein